MRCKNVAYSLYNAWKGGETLVIGQHYYTNEKSGLFRPSEGYDSIAKSNGLSDVYIKRVLHPFCFYDVPKCLEDVGATDASMFPDSMFFFRTETGEIILGRSAYVEKDYTGSHSTFFTHQLIIPEADADRYVENIDNLIFACGFKDSYDIAKGKELPELECIDYDADKAKEGLDTLYSLGITHELFREILYSAFLSASNKKKIFITFGDNIKNISEHAKVLLKYILGCLPYKIRENLGYITYCREPESRKNISIYFVEAEGMKTMQLRYDKEYVFDLANNRILNVDPDFESHPYIKFADDNINDKNNMDLFFMFASDLTSNMKEQLKLSPAVYDELCILYGISEGDVEAYLKYKDRILQYISKYSKHANTSGLEAIGMVYNNILLEEIKQINSDPDYMPPADLIKYCIEYYGLSIKDVNANIIQFLECAIERGSGNWEYISPVISNLMQNVHLYEELLKRDKNRCKVKTAVHRYISESFLRSESLSGLTDMITYWNGISQEMMMDDSIKELIYNKVAELLKGSRSIVRDGKTIEEYFYKLGDSGRSSISEDCREFSYYMAAFVEDYTYRHIDLNSITKDEIMELSLKNIKDEPKFRILEYVRNLVTGGEVTSCDIFKSEEGEMVKSIIRRIYRNDVNEETYPIIILGFIKTPVRYSIGYDFKELLNYISKSGRDALCRFILWTFDIQAFDNNSGLQEYMISIKEYFKNNDRGVFKDKEAKKLLYSTENKTLARLLYKTDMELKSPAARFFAKHRKALIYWAVFIVLGGALMLWLVKML